MSEENKSEDDIFNELTGGEEVQIITITMRPGVPPSIDLGRVHPTQAVAIFDSGAEALRTMMIEPNITYDGMLIYESILLGYDEDEDQEDD